MVLSKPGILKAREEGRIVISPFNESHLQTASYDVKLHNTFYDVVSFHEAMYANLGEKSLDQYKLGRSRTLNGKAGMTVPSHQRILACTEEFIGGLHNVVAEMRARSSTARHGITVCACAGWGDVGFTGRWTMEIFNMNPYSVFIPFGVRIAQIVFYEVSDVIPGNEDYKALGNYEAGFAWQPSDMLPKPLKP